MVERTGSGGFYCKLFSEVGLGTYGNSTWFAYGVYFSYRNGNYKREGTKAARGAIPHQQGKVTKLLDSTHKKPLLACGNTIWDYELIDSSTHVKLAVSSQFAGIEDVYLEEWERQLQIKAKEKSWLSHSF